MKNSKITSLISIFLLIFSAGFVIIFIGSIREIRSIIESTDHYRNAISEMQPLSPAYLSRLENQVKDLRDWKAPESPAGFSAEDRFAMIRDLLRAHTITIERFRTTGKEGTASAEFIPNGKSINFLNFLKGAPEIRIPLSYIGIKPAPNFSTLNVTVRFNHVP
jgi:hypothetical protein